MNKEETVKVLQVVLFLKEGVPESKIMIDYELGQELKKAKSIINNVEKNERR